MGACSYFLRAKTIYDLIYACPAYLQVLTVLVRRMIEDEEKRDGDTLEAGISDDALDGLGEAAEDDEDDPLMSEGEEEEKDTWM